MSNDCRTIQQIFDAVIAGGCYAESQEYALNSAYMCTALTFAFQKNIISYEEMVEARKAISEYLGHTSNSLWVALYENLLPCSFSHRLAIYRNWAARPELVSE